MRLFREHPDVLADYRSRFRYMLVDEYQDTNTVQYQWLKLLALGSDGADAAFLPPRGGGAPKGRRGGAPIADASIEA